MKHLKREMSYHLMLLPGMLVLVLFTFVPLFGLVMAFQNYVPAKGISGSKFVGLQNFKFLFVLPDSKQILINTLIIALGKMILAIVIPVCFALLLNEIRIKWFKKTVQTVVYLPHFLSWVILASVVQFIFGYDGPVNAILSLFGVDPIMFMASNNWFRPLMIITETWKEFGYGSIIYLAALTSIDPGLYEAAAIDGAGRWKQMFHVTLPGILPMIILMTTMSLPNILNAGFDQIYNLYNPLVYETGDILDTFVYRVGMVERQYSLATAVGLIKSVVGMVLILSANKLAGKLTDRKIF
ncbi:polygalacturonan/rhamnogalacturonan ABC transporter permease [Anaerocolumna aminovalerica]|jgi:putative aldouronate transport system permease protein|uniref:Putative aldouronate transport system permease protein n=1 Tax=Anaerocolumna aminovalerica TaxID=1527 RepID=A0A1I5GP72_9FIRM|nr:ABC transporter permease subunit [Anaerocolumna aminovalerica]MBU5331186.1 ABC transporter permease subunit [Anaerocolumna aminovalerica]MDU6263222.1 ABC transporter permease subunit [Anaerocolumna aminovalerica]SFO37818.1 putative aldouronate transport system permease protein [Anaerocolumna aminovalerica]